MEKTLEFAAALLTARTECGGNDVRFSQWLTESGLEELDDHTRAALIGIAQHPDLAGRVLRQTGRRSIRYIWDEEIKPVVAKHAVPALIHTDSMSPPAQSFHDRADPLCSQSARDQNERQEGEKLQENQQDTPVLADRTEAASPPPPADPVRVPTNVKLKITSQSGYFGLPRADEIIPLFSRNARYVLSIALKHSDAARRDIWELMLTCFDAGLLRQSDLAPSRPGRLSLRFLLPDAPQDFVRDYDLLNGAVRKEIRTVVLPAILEQKDVYLKDPNSLKRLITAFRIKQNAALAAELQVKPHVPPVINPPESQPTVVMYGVQLWPIVETRFGRYDYDQLRTAIWHFQEVDQTLLCGSLGTTPEGRAIRIRFSTRYLGAFAKRALDDTNGWRMQVVFQLVHGLADLLATDPDAVCTPPVTPHGSNLGWD